MPNSKWYEDVRQLEKTEANRESRKLENERIGFSYELRVSLTNTPMTATAMAITAILRSAE